MTSSSEDDFGRDLYSIPSSSNWFQWDEIHGTERRELPDFFDGSAASRNVRVYKEYRDFIINKFREDPSRRLTFTEVRKSLIGDVGTLRKVFLFLERWGLINFGVSDGRPRPTEEVGPRVVVEEPGAGVQVMPASSKLASGRSVAAATAAGAGETGFRLPPLSSYSDVFGDWAPGKGPVCAVCGDQCVSGRHEPLMEGGFVVCLKCSKTENEIEGKSADDNSDRVDGNANHATGAWTDAETLLLLEAVLKHGDDWDLIAQHVRTKNRLDCIARLIQLPFGDHMLGTFSGKYDAKNSGNQATNTKAIQHASSELLPEPKTDGHVHNDVNEKVEEESIPVHPSKRRHIQAIANATDSLMKQVALLSTVAGPHVAATAAEAAVTALSDENPWAGEVFNIDEDEARKKRKSFPTNNEPKSDVKVEDQDVEMHKQTDTPVLSEKNFSATAFQTKAAIATALGAAAARAKLLADQEGREMELLVASIIEAQMRKIQYKIKHFKELEFIMEKEYTLIQQMKESLLDKWVEVIQQIFQAGIPRWKDNVFPKSLWNHGS
ncbi:SWI/SNF complex subunit SWI3A [Phoenix dactylifera]|uniref:SWI/SNF complex subunit SWI3A n=1 Tax=Phoenix dactylifera TaxID=42345 RepID=A0A8B7CCZ3_PHODC|nr:SWI/SNF complex subunit SWI3A [Phoenix dactylifera]